MLILIGRGLDLRGVLKEKKKPGAMCERSGTCGSGSRRSGGSGGAGSGAGTDLCSFQGTMKKEKEHTISGGNGEREPPVPIPNTEVKPLSAESTWLETARENRTLPDSKRLRRVISTQSFFSTQISKALDGTVE